MLDKIVKNSISVKLKVIAQHCTQGTLTSILVSPSLFVSDLGARTEKTNGRTDG